MEAQLITKNTSIVIAKLKVKRINLVIFGHGNVGNQLVKQVHESQQELAHKRNLDVQIVAIANSKRALQRAHGIGNTWEEELAIDGEEYKIQDIINFVQQHQLENLIVVDNTADAAFTEYYEPFVENGFHIVSSNKHKNTSSWEAYQQLRSTLEFHEKQYLYETNVGAGLPLIDTIKLLHQSGENITRIRGVFSGSLSFLFNEFSESTKTFSTALEKAITRGYTEPDPREDLCGMDVARKLLILARELELKVELDDVLVQNLIPKALRNLSKDDFLKQLSDIDTTFHIKRKNLKPDTVLRYVGEVCGDLSKEDGAILTVSLQETPKNSMLGQLNGSDSIFEIYTQSYGANPIVIQGAGAGAAVTARGVFGDVLRISNQLN